MKNYKVIVAHPGKQHSFRLAKALKNEGYLFKYITTIYDKEDSLLMKILKRVLGKSNLKRANSRKCDFLKDEEVIQFSVIQGLLLLVLIRIDKSKKIYNWLNNRIADNFGKKVANYAIENDVDAVILYDTNATTCFEILKKKSPNIKRILDASIANRLFTRQVYEEDFRVSKEISYEGKQNLKEIIKNEKKLLDEIKNSEYFLVPSYFVEKSYIYSGVMKTQIFKVPYGANLNDIEEKNDTNEFKSELNFLFVGQVSYRKGCHYLLEAFSKISKPNITLTMVGNIESEYLFRKYKKQENIKFLADGEIL